MSSSILAAEYTNGGKAHGATLTLNRIAGGTREFVMRIPVDGKREARKVAADLGAKPWNF